MSVKTIHRLTFGEAETLSATVDAAITGCEQLKRAGVLDTAAVGSFLGMVGVGMDEMQESEFLETVEMKLRELKSVREKLRSIYGI